MVSGGNVTGITDQLEREGPRRSHLRSGRPPRRRGEAHCHRPKRFRDMAARHERWIVELLAGLESGRTNRDVRDPAEIEDALHDARRHRAGVRQHWFLAAPTRRPMRHLAGDTPSAAWHAAARGLRRAALPVRGRDAVATITLNRPERKNPLTFESYAELRDLFRALVHATDVKAIVITGRRGEFLLRRRRARDHRPADEARHARTSRVHPDDRRSGQSHARLPAADRRGDRWRLRRRGRDPGHGL